MQLGIVGTGKMGYNLVLRLKKRGHKVVAHNRSPEPLYKLHDQGVEVSFTLDDLLIQLKSPRVLWLMVSNSSVDRILDLIESRLEEGDIIIDGGNSFYKDSVARYKRLRGRGVSFIDVGFCGRPKSVLDGASLMVGGDIDAFKDTEKIFKDLSVPEGYAYLGESGSGHFAKMVYNGIEHGMILSLAEGFGLIKNSGFGYDLNDVLKVYSQGSVISQDLTGHLKDIYDEYGRELKGADSGKLEPGEVKLLVKTAKELNVPVKTIETSLKSLLNIKKKPNFPGKVAQALKGEMGQGDGSGQ